MTTHDPIRIFPSDIHLIIPICISFHAWIVSGTILCSYFREGPELLPLLSLLRFHRVFFWASSIVDNFCKNGVGSGPYTSMLGSSVATKSFGGFSYLRIEVALLEQQKLEERCSERLAELWIIHHG